jgi:hypothetical protein
MLSMVSKIISGVIGLIYLTVAFIAGGPIVGVQAAIVLVFPLALIWFSEELGSISSGMMGHSYVTAETPGCFLAFFGWAFLSIPAIALLFHLFKDDF